MNRNKIKTYAPQARRDFIRAVTDRAALFGITKDKTEKVVEQGDVVLIGGRPYPRTVAAQRKGLVERIVREGFDPVMEAVAYTWFNRFVAIRYMELHNYLDHGFRVLSHPEGRNTPEILEHAEEVSLPGLRRESVIELKLAGNKEPELYRKLLTAQCNALHDAMPFLFERIDDETELLLPDNLLQTDSIVRNLVAGIDEEDWQEVEIVGWLYEAYISERYEQVIGKVVASADIPAATQRFTPKWIVRYLVQNTLGRQWLATYPQSPLKGQMKYYIELAEQTPEVQEQLRAITPTSLNPEEITFLDPACGSAHILVEAYDVFKAIYQERGYRAREIPRLILTKNLFGLEIDDRAAQLAAFALMMKARADDRRIFEQHVQPNVRSFIETAGMDAEDIAATLNVSDSKEAAPEGHLFETEDNLFTRAASAMRSSTVASLTDVKALVDLFVNAKAFGSLIQIPPKLAGKLPDIELRLNDLLKHGNLSQYHVRAFKLVVGQAIMLSQHYDVVAANPPYIGGRNGMNPELKSLVRAYYPDSKADIYAAFVKRGLGYLKQYRRLAMVTMHSWMFLSSFEEFRRDLLARVTIENMAHLGPRAFANISGEVVQTTAFTVYNHPVRSYRPVFLRLVDGGEEDKRIAFLARQSEYVLPAQEELNKVPGSPLAYWLTNAVRQAFEESEPLENLATPRQGLATSDNQRFVRYWHEVSFTGIAFGCRDRAAARTTGKRWFPFNKGGSARRWFGNNDYVVDWYDDGAAIKESIITKYPYLNGNADFVAKNTDFYFRPGITWSALSSDDFCVRKHEQGFIFADKGQALFPFAEKDYSRLFCLLNSKVATIFLRALSPSLDFNSGYLKKIPVCQTEVEATLAEQAVTIAAADWNSGERSWAFERSPLILAGRERLSESFDKWQVACSERIHLLRLLEEKNNRLFIEAFGFQDELSPDVPDDQITLYRPNREEDIKRLVSYAVGCMLGRYGLDEPGLIYARGGNVGFDPARYKTFPADQDGIIPVTETPWFADDATNRFVEFVGAAWPKETLEENLTFVAESLGPSKGEAPRDTIRRYLATGFYKHHLQIYKRRPIYWLFSSGKQRAFQCLVYLHRYHEGTLSRMRTEYVIPLQGMIAARIEHLAGDITAATSTAQRKKLEKERETLLKQQAELHTFDEKLRHLADKRITLDLDDGVKVNYGKFGDLLAEVKAVTGGGEED